MGGRRSGVSGAQDPAKRGRAAEEQRGESPDGQGSEQGGQLPSSQSVEESGDGIVGRFVEVCLGGLGIEVE
jgi:hypothetical protein